MKNRVIEFDYVMLQGGSRILYSILVNLVISINQKIRDQLNHPRKSVRQGLQQQDCLFEKFPKSLYVTASEVPPQYHAIKFPLLKPFNCGLFAKICRPQRMQIFLGGMLCSQTKSSALAGSNARPLSCSNWNLDMFCSCVIKPDQTCYICRSDAFLFVLPHCKENPAGGNLRSIARSKN